MADRTEHDRHLTSPPQRVTPSPAQDGLAARTITADEIATRVRRLADATVHVTNPDGPPSVATVSTGGGSDRAATPRFEVVVDGWRFELDVEDERRATLRERARRDPEHGSSGGPAEIRAIIPGRVVTVDVAAGDEVAVGDRLFVLEAMKMQNELRAQRAGRVARIAVGEGQNVETGDLLLVLE
jgi:biotin carboxyl carrier protein